MNQNNIDHIFSNYIHALATNSVYVQMRWYKDLYKMGSSIIPKIEKNLFAYYSAEIKRDLKMLYISGLGYLLHDIDETKANDILNRLILKVKDPIIKNRIKTILNFTLKDFRNYMILNIQIYEHSDLNNSLKSKLEKLISKIPKDDLSKIDRIYLIPFNNQKYSGQYLPIFYNIDLVVRQYKYYNPINYLYSLLVEHTLYHEFGHHYYNHSFGEDRDQEDEANRYANKYFFKNHIILRYLSNVIRIFRTNKKK